MIVAAGTDRLDGVRVIGVDEHRWSHTRHSDGFVTVIIDLTPVLAGTGPARLLDLVPAFRSGPDQLAGQPVTAVPRPDRGGGHGRLRRLQDRRASNCPRRPP